MDGIIPGRYPLKESSTTAYSQRTALNVRDSDGTLILNQGPLESGTAYTVEVAEQLSRPYLLVRLEERPDPNKIAGWIQGEGIRVLNVAGPREEKRPGIYALAAESLRDLLTIPGVLKN